MARLLVASLLIGALSGPVGTEELSLPSLLKILELRRYPSGIRPPRFSARTLDARDVSLEALQGQVVILNFWATWCAECRLEMPVLERLHRDFGSRGVDVLAINAGEDAATARAYASDLHLSLAVVLDPGRTINALYGVVALPTTFLVARDGRAIALAVGPREWSSAPARAMLEALLAEPASRPVGR